MPSIQDLNAFKNAINQLGNEPAVAESRAEMLEDVQPGEEALPLMPELLAAPGPHEGAKEFSGGQEAREGRAEAQSGSTPAPMRDEGLAADNFGRDWDFFDNEENPESPATASHALPSEFDELLYNSTGGDTEKILAPPAASDIAAAQEPESIAETSVIPQAVYQMLDVGFGELDSERLSAEILEDDEEEDTSAIIEFPEPPAKSKEEPASSALEAENSEEPRPSGGAEEVISPVPEDQEFWAAEESAADSFIAPGESDFSIIADSEAAAIEDEQPLEETAEGLDFEAPVELPGGQETGASGDFDDENSTDPASREDELPGPPEQNVSALEDVAQLEQALQQHRSSIDLLNISEEDIEEDEHKYEELEFYIPHEGARDFLLQLSLYPIALKLAIEEEIGENELNEAAVETLVEMVSSGANPRKVANYFFSQTGKRIILPKSHRYHGLDHTKPDTRFHRQFAQIGWPLLRYAFHALVLIALLLWLPFYYVYRPIQSHLYYRKGYSQIQRDHFSDAEYYFTLASDGWPLFNDTVFVKGWPYRSWYLKYAQAYAGRKDFAESTFKLRETLRLYPDYRAAWFQYILLLSREMGEYAKAEELIQRYYDRFGRDYDSLIVRGQNYLHWGEVDPARYEDARKVFATTYSLESRDDLPLLYLLDSYIRTTPYSNNEAQLQKLTSFFLEADPLKLQVPPDLFARVMSKTADYYLEEGNVAVAKKLLLNAKRANSNSMEVYRSLARYYELIGDRANELEALDMSEFFLRYRDERDDESVLLEKLALSRQRAHFAARSNETPLAASMVLNHLMAQLKEAERRHLLFDQSQNADVYAMFGDFYYQNMPSSLSAVPYYQKAIALGTEDPYLRYRFGYQLYQKGDFERAVPQFLESQLALKGNNKVKYALGNSLLQAGSFNSAQGALEDAYSSLQEELRSSFLIDPQYSQEARDRLFMLVRLANDLGVSYYREALQSPNIRNEEMAMTYLIQGLGYLDVLSRESTVSLKLPAELLFRPRLLTKKTIDLLEAAVPAQGLVPGSLPDRNLKEILGSRISLPLANPDIQPYWLDINDPIHLQQTMDY